MSKCYAYGRHSTAKQGLTEAQQKRICINYYNSGLRKKGVKWGGFFYDSAQSGGSMWSERDMGRELYFRLQAGDHLLVSKYDRIFRSTRDGYNRLAELRERGIRFHTQYGEQEVRTAMGEAMEGYNLVNAQLIRSIAREQTYSFIDGQKEMCLPYSRGCAMGYKKIKRHNRWCYRDDPDEKRVCKVLSDKYDGGKSYEYLQYWIRHKSCPVTCKRKYGHVNYIKWSVLAHENDYPVNYASYQKFFKALKEGTLDTRTLADAVYA
jgi:hypothetical protein